ncbi:DeoR/GlpR family DNA-binding transcription regulator [Bacillus sp. FJAT-50079]|uniref:DeoR/GlpR family DNA-binding transcription regulator n=1 Tax=Bacillus sp. FJAT-50079 TaxID=2833577 RepID=UPI001BC9C500|nr:DeoR/GlpR family DNA-binding transcription regulator [Bacillus sp. FJAT-50079]MBS4208214.1 DeoR/GlpR transcriptional regulator [Bacillus sp. FJAT-50079]
MNKKKLRQLEILSYLEIMEEVSVEELSIKHNISEVSIRRDLEELEQEGNLIRTHGGARRIIESPHIAKNFKERAERMLKEKELIVDRVAEMIPDGSTITLESGTTNWLLAKRLKRKKQLTVATSSIRIMEELYNAPDIKLLVTGGKFRERNMDFVGAKAVDFMKDFYSDLAIITCDSIRPGLGVYKLDEDSADIAKSIVSSAKQIYVVADHSKINANGPYRFLPSEKVDILFTDSNILPANKEKMKNECYKIIYC